ncbi:uncharacterized protein LOC127716009 isoform X3 [Mytilus californianus]|uniref:uncharacterized protein LOC127716009 isoform X3 n=1 Tax=Mytilus californianus TaxID=6549 RepID=UPI002246ED7E|nr:uncharacterized protein LOC127716009 isoform X3 [Mytilus californianus]
MYQNEKYSFYLETYHSENSQKRHCSDTNVTIVGKKDFLKTTLQVGQYMDDFSCAKTVGECVLCLHHLFFLMIYLCFCF